MDAQTLSIQPWDKGLLADIDRAVQQAGLGLNPTNNGETLLVRVPTLTEERRRELVKVAKKLTEDAKISIRNTRSDYHKKIKNAESNKEIGEDFARDYENDLQKHVDITNKEIDDMCAQKEQDIMKV